MRQKLICVFIVLTMTVLFVSCHVLDGDGMENTTVTENDVSSEYDQDNTLTEAEAETEEGKSELSETSTESVGEVTTEDNSSANNVTEENKEQNYQVINCNEWVSLREGPGTSYKRLKKVPLGAIVTDFNKVVDGFRYVWFEDMSGYIGEDYLQIYTEEFNTDENYIDGSFVYPAFQYEKEMKYEEILSFGNDPQKLNYGEYTLLYSKAYTDAGEIMKVGCFQNKKSVWGYVTGIPYSAELDATAVIPVGTVQDMCYALIFNSEIGLRAVDFFDGSIVWEIRKDDLGVGGSPCYVVDEDGTLYISGYYDAGPVAVTLDGEVLWSAKVSDSNVYWPYKIQVKEERILVTYASEQEKGTYVVTFDKKSGKEKKIEIIPF